MLRLKYGRWMRTAGSEWGGAGEVGGRQLNLTGQSLAWSRSKIRLVRKEGRLREPSLQALLRELAAFNKGLCVIATRTPVADIADHERTSALRRDLKQLSSDAGAKLLERSASKGWKSS